MRELSLNILDIVENSIRAQALHIIIDINADTSLDKLVIGIFDDGCGMSEEFTKNVLDPFTTTRTTRKVGMGLSLLRMATESTDGTLNIKSGLGVGTEVIAVFKLTHIDRMPLGNLVETMIILLQADEKVDYLLNYCIDGRKFTFNAADIREIMGDIPLNSMEILDYIKGYLEENLNIINGGLYI